MPITTYSINGGGLYGIRELWLATYLSIIIRGEFMKKRTVEIVVAVLSGVLSVLGVIFSGRDK